MSRARPDHPRGRSAPATWICVCGHANDVVIIFQVSSKSVQGFQSPRVSKFALSHYFGYWLLQQLVLPNTFNKKDFLLNTFAIGTTVPYQR